MQTRKRAKSISFGKPKKEVEETSVEKEEKVSAPVVSEEHETKHVKEEVPELSSTLDTTESSEPTEAAKKVIEEEETPELSSTLSSEAPKDEFLTDTQPDKEEPEEEEKKDSSEESSGLSDIQEPTLSTPIIESDEKSSEPTLAEAAEANEKNAEEEDLSSTPPPSAFSLQEGEDLSAEPTEGKKKNVVVYFLVIALFSFILGIGAMALLSSGFLPVSMPKNIPFLSQDVQPTTTAAPTQAVKPTAEPTEKALDLKAYTISVLNGSGIKGKAAEAKDALTSAGFKVGTTGNAPTSDFTATEISAKKEVDEAFLDKLKEELEKDYEVEISAAPASASQAADVVVTLGKNAAK